MWKWEGSAMSRDYRVLGIGLNRHFVPTAISTCSNLTKLPNIRRFKIMPHAPCDWNCTPSYIHGADQHLSGEIAVRHVRVVFISKAGIGPFKAALNRNPWLEALSMPWSRSRCRLAKQGYSDFYFNLLPLCAVICFPRLVFKVLKLRLSILVVLFPDALFFIFCFTERPTLRIVSAGALSLLLQEFEGLTKIGLPYDKSIK